MIKIDIVPDIENNTYITNETLSWEVGLKGNGNWVKIPAGTKFDVSVPFPFRWFINPNDSRWFIGALVHDYFINQKILGRAQSAAEFYDGSLAGGAPKWKARIAYVAVAFWAVYKPTD